MAMALSFLQFFRPNFFMGSLSFDDWIWIRETENGSNRCHLLLFVDFKRTGREGNSRPGGSVGRRDDAIPRLGFNIPILES